MKANSTLQLHRYFRWITALFFVLVSALGMDARAQTCTVYINNCPPALDNPYCANDVQDGISGAYVSWPQPDIGYTCPGGGGGGSYAYVNEFNIPASQDPCWDYNGMSRTGNDGGLVRIGQSNQTGPNPTFTSRNYFYFNGGTPTDMYVDIAANVNQTMNVYLVDENDNRTLVHTHYFAAQPGVVVNYPFTVTAPENGMYRVEYEFIGPSNFSNSYIDNVGVDAVIVGGCEGGVANFQTNTTRSDNRTLADIYPVGTTTVTYTAVFNDGNGNLIDSEECSFDVVVVAAAPTITCPTVATSYNADPGVCSASLTFAATVTEAECEGANTSTLTYWIGTTQITFPYAFPVGSTTVTARADNGISDPVECTFTVVVVDNQPPVLIVPVGADLGCNPEVLPTIASVEAESSVTDNCSATITVVAGERTGTCTVTQSFTVTATDLSGNTDIETVTYTWKADTEAPVIATTATSGDLGCNPTVTAPVFTVTDNCDANLVAEVTTEGPVADGCNYTQSWTATVTDACDNEATPVTITYTWKVDTEAPVISTTATSGDLGCNPTVTAPVFTVTDNCDANLVADVTTSGPVADGCNYTQSWTATVTDACDNEATPVTITYTWKVDTEAPVIATTATSGDLGCNPTVTAPVFTVTDNCDAELVAEVTTEGPVADGCNYTQSWTATVTDACDNEATPVTITYTWKVDTEAPVIATTATSGDLGCNPTVTAPVFTVTDNCDANLVAEVTTEGPSADGCIYMQSWTATVTDACDNEATPVTITYTWKVDTEAPVIATMATSGDLGNNPTVTAPEFTVTDNCDMNLVAEVTTEGPVASGDCSYTQSWTATVTDACGNQAAPVTITYTWTEDSGTPVISTTATSEDLGCNPTVTAPVFTGMDPCTGEFTPEVDTEGPVADGCNYTQSWTATYTNANGNEAVPVTITYTWKVDTEAPVISTTATSGDLGCNPTVTAPVFTVTDNCDANLVAEVTTEGPVADGCNYTQSWTATVTDACDNEATPVTITYTWKVDTEAPVIATTATSGDLGCNPTVTAPVFTVTDNCDANLVAEVTTEGPSADGCIYTQSWTATVTDACGNQATPVTITYTWKVDTEAPVIATTATSGDLGNNPTVTAPEFTVTDNCDMNLVAEVTTEGPVASGDCSYTQSWTATVTDACGNQATPVTITYTWTEDSGTPVISTTATSEDLGCNPTVTAPVFTGMDACTGEFTPEVDTEGPVADGCNYTQSWTATYTNANGNEAVPVTITYTWKVDTEAPVISTTATSGDLGCNPTVTAPVFTVTDNCDANLVAEVTTEGPVADGCNYTQSWTATVTDACDNEATPVTITYTWKVDTEAPVIATTATSGDLGCNPTVTAPVFTVTDNCDANLVAEVTTEGPSADGCIYTQSWTATVTDACGNQATPVTITYTWKVDTEGPVIVNSPDDVTVSCSGEVPPVNTGLITATDGCGGIVRVVHVNDVPSQQTCANRYIITRTYRVFDECQNSTDVIQIITVNDNVAPVLTGTLPGGSDINACYVDENTLPAGVPAFASLNVAQYYADNCPGAVTATLVGTTIVNSATGWTVTYTFTVADVCGNSTAIQTITYSGMSKDAPEIVGCPSMNGLTFQTGRNATTCSATVDFSEFNLSVSSCGNEVPATDVTWIYTIAGMTVDATSYEFPVGETEVVVVAIVNGIMSAECEFTVTVVDNTAPMITCPEPVSIQSCEPTGTEVMLETPTATDNCGTAEVTFTSRSDGMTLSDPYPVGTTTVTWTATDEAGNTATCSTTVTIEDIGYLLVNYYAFSADNRSQSAYPFPATETYPGVTSELTPDALTYSNINGGGNSSMREQNPGVATTPDAFKQNPVDPALRIRRSTRDEPGDVYMKFSVDGAQDFGTFQLYFQTSRWPSAVERIDVLVSSDCDAPKSEWTKVGEFAYPSHNTWYALTYDLPASLNGDDSWCFMLDPVGGEQGNSSSDIMIDNVQVQALNKRPVINCGDADITVASTPGECTANVTVPEPTVTDDCGTPVVTATRSDNAALTLSDPYPVGVTTIMFVATDEGGLSDTCYTTVTVVAAPLAVDDLYGNVQRPLPGDGNQTLGNILDNDQMCPGAATLANVTICNVTPSATNPSTNVWIDAATGNVIIAPGAEMGSYQFVYTICAGELESTATVTVTIDRNLPVTGLILTGQRNQRDVKLNWKTTTEINTNYFVVERSFDGTNFSPIPVGSRVNAAGNSQAQRNYYGDDLNVTNEIVFYRVKLYDLDGSVRLSNVVAIRYNESKKLRVYPNPVVDYVVIDFGDNGKYQLEMFGLNGQLVYLRKDLEINNGMRSITIPRGNLAPGNYNLRVYNQTTGKVEWVRIIIHNRGY